MMQPPRSMLASRYELTAPLKFSRHVEGWVGFEVTTGMPVRVAVVDALDLSRYDRLEGAQQVHLTGVLETIPEASGDELPGGYSLGPKRGLVVLEYVGGATLHRALEAGAVVPPFKAVAWCLRLLDALEILHDRGVAHGAVNPRSVLVEPIGRFIPPVLTLASAPALGAYCSPERIRGGEASTADDVWAILATLYRMVTGSAPFKDTEAGGLLAEASRGRPTSLQKLGVDDSELQRLFDAGFEPSVRQRLAKVDELRKALDRWEREEMPVLVPRAASSRSVPRLGALTLGSLAAPSPDLVYSDASLPLEEGEAPELSRRRTERKSQTGTEGAVARKPGAPGDGDRAPPQAHQKSSHWGRPDSTVSQAAARRLRRRANPWLMLAIPIVLAGLGVAYLEYGDRLGISSEDPETVPESAAQAPSAAEREAPRSPKSAPLTRTEQLSQCVASYFPPNIFPENADFAFVCGEGDFRDITTRLMKLGQPDVDAGSPAAAHARAEKPPSAEADGLLVVKSSINVKAQQLDLGWYELVAAIIARAGCCQSPPSIELPKTRGWCLQLEKAVRQIAVDSQKPGDLSPTIHTFDEAVECLFANQIPRPYDYALRPSSKQRAMLQRFLTRVAESEAKRSSRR